MLEQYWRSLSSLFFSLSFIDQSDKCENVLVLSYDLVFLVCVACTVQFFVENIE